MPWKSTCESVRVGVGVKQTLQRKWKEAGFSAPVSLHYSHYLLSPDGGLSCPPLQPNQAWYALSDCAEVVMKSGSMFTHRRR